MALNVTVFVRHECLMWGQTRIFQDINLSAPTRDKAQKKSNVLLRYMSIYCNLLKYIFWVNFIPHTSVCNVSDAKIIIHKGKMIVS